MSWRATTAACATAACSATTEAISPGSIGFGARVIAPQDRKEGEIFREVEPEDLLKYGLIPEFVGRLPIIATLEDLDETSLKLILTQPKNALV